MPARAVVHIVRTGTANLASVVAALGRCGVAPVVTGDAGEIRRAEAVVLPGVGAFGAAMESIERAGLVDVLRERVDGGRAMLAICLGLQVLFESSEESPGVRGIGVVKGVVGRFAGAVRVPQLGWNAVEAEPACKTIESGFAYYANSYRVSEAPAGWNCAWSEHGGRFVGAIERGMVLACQFHPELSGAWGAGLLARWLAKAGVIDGASASAATVSVLGSSGGAACGGGAC